MRRRGHRRTQGRRREQAAEKDTDGPDGRITEETHAEDLDHEGGGVGPEEVVVDAEDELVVPGRVGAAVSVDAGRQLAPGVRPRHSVGLHAPRYRVQVLRGDYVELEKVERRRQRCRLPEIGHGR